MRWVSRWLTRLWRRRPRLSRMHPKIPDRTQARFNNLEDRLDHLHETMRKLNKRLDDIEWRLAGLETKPPS